MGLNRYDCGCGQLTPNSRTFGNTGCCNNPIQHPPQECCESHTRIYQHGICLYVTCNVVTVADTTFYLSFCNTSCSNIPINANEVFFYHASAGLMQIVSFDGVAYGVKLVDSSRAGRDIAKGDCILVSVQSETGTATLNTRCLSGNFTVPPVNGDPENIYILNGSGIPVGATITFTYQGETGSYVVTDFVAANGNIYTYKVQNTGNGHTVGTTIVGDCDGACTVPIEVITEVDICDLSESQVLDTITGCLNGSPRAMVPAGPNSVISSNEEGGQWDQRFITSFDCCVVIDDCLKWSGNICPDGADEVPIRETNIDCFEAAWEEALAADQKLSANINGFRVLISDYDSGSRLVTIEPASNDPLAEPITYAAGDQICLGDCCDSCLTGNQNTDAQHINPENFPEDSLIGCDILDASLIAPVGVSYWLIGRDYNTLAVTIRQVDAAYIAEGPGDGPGYPRIEDPLVVRQKICNTDPKGCDQLALLQFNVILAYDPMPASMKIDWEVAHYAQNSQFLSDGVTPNPYSNISTQQKLAGSLQGPSVVEALLLPTSFSTGNPTNNKVFPFAAGDFRDFIELRKCSCAMSIVWWFMRIEHAEAEPVALNTVFTFRRQIIKMPWNLIPNPLNAATQEGFNGL